MKKVKLIVSDIDRTVIVAALSAYAWNGDILYTNISKLGEDIATVPTYDPTDDGPEVAILSVPHDAA